MSIRHLLLDTHAFLWWLDDNHRLGKSTRSLIDCAENVVYVNAASILEIAIKKRIGKLEAPDQLAGIIEEEGFSPLPIMPGYPVSSPDTQRPVWPPADCPGTGRRVRTGFP